MSTSTVELTVRSPRGDMTAVINGQVIKRALKGKKGSKPYELPTITYPDASLDKVRKLLEGLARIEPDLIEAEPEPEAPNPKEASKKAPEKNRSKKARKTANASMAPAANLALKEGESVVGQLVGFGKWMDHRYNQKRFGMNLMVQGRNRRIWGSGLAEAIKTSGVKPGDRVRVTMLERGSDKIASLYQIQKI